MKIKNILVLTTWSYKEGLIQSSTIPYLRMIHVLTPSSKIYLVTQEIKKLGKVEKAVADADLNKFNIILIPQQYNKIGIRKLFVSAFQFLQLAILIFKRKISHIHCFCTPAGAAGYILSSITGKKLILDSYEPHAESMVENGTWTSSSRAFKTLWALEKKQSQKADYTIAAASGMKDYAKTKYGIDLNKFGVRPACVDLEKFQFNNAARESIRLKLNWQNKIVVVYAGKFGGIYLEKEVFDFLKVAEEYWGDKLRCLLLTNHSIQEIKSFCKTSAFPFDKIHHVKASYSEMPNYLSAADFALTPVKPVPSKKFCTPIKDGEYWAIGLPVVITKDISDDSEIISKNNIGIVLNNLSKEEYLSAVKEMDKLLQEDPATLKGRIRNIAEYYRNYDIARDQYRRIYTASD